MGDECSMPMKHVQEDEGLTRQGNIEGRMGRERLAFDLKSAS